MISPYGCCEWMIFLWYFFQTDNPYASTPPLVEKLREPGHRSLTSTNHVTAAKDPVQICFSANLLKTNARQDCG